MSFIIAQYLSEPQRFGAAAEAWTLAELQRRGYDARPVARWADSADLLLVSPYPLLIEVKAARRREFWQRGRGRRFRYSWNVNRIPSGQDMAVVLIAQDGDGNRHPFIVPSWRIVGRGVTVIHMASEPAEYAGRGRGWLAPFYSRWETIPEVITQRRRRQGLQLPLFETTRWL